MENQLKIQLGPLYNATETSIENLEFVTKNSEDFQEDTHILKVEKTKDSWGTFIESLLVVLK